MNFLASSDCRIGDWQASQPETKSEVLLQITLWDTKDNFVLLDIRRKNRDFAILAACIKSGVYTKNKFTLMELL